MTVLAGAIGVGDAQIVVNTTLTVGNYPAPYTIGTENIAVTGGSGSTVLSVLRGQNGTAAASHLVGTAITGGWYSGGGAPEAHHVSHESGGSDALSAQAPAAHHVSHEDGGSDEIDVTGLAGAGVPTSRTITAGTGLTGGGDLSADRTLAADFGTSSGTVTQGDDSRLSDARTPVSHATSHEGGGGDEVFVKVLTGATVVSFGGQFAALDGSDLGGGDSQAIGGQGAAGVAGGSAILRGGFGDAGNQYGASVDASGGGPADPGLLFIRTGGDLGTAGQLLGSDGSFHVVWRDPAAHVADGSTVDQLRNALIAAGLMRAS